MGLNEEKGRGKLCKDCTKKGDSCTNKIGDKIECIHDKTLYICEIIDLNSNKVKIIEKAVSE